MWVYSANFKLRKLLIKNILKNNINVSLNLINLIFWMELLFNKKKKIKG
jgi:hypothetical protein